MVDSERLIMVIQNYQCIWNTSMQEYHNKNLKDTSWNSVCDDLIENWVLLSPQEKTVKLNDIKKRWNNIRDYYKKEIQQQKNVGTGQPSKKRKKYVFADILDFLRPVLERNNTNDGNYEHAGRELENGSTITTATSSIPTTASTTTSTSSPRPLVTHKNNKSTGKLNAFESSIVKALENKSKTADVTGYHLRPVEDDPDLMFLKSLLPDLRVLTSSQKFEFKIGIMQLLRSIRTTGFQSSSYTHDNYRPNYQQNTLLNIPLHRNIRNGYAPMPAYSPTSTMSRSPTPTYQTSPAILNHTGTPIHYTAGDDNSNEAQYILSTTNEQYLNTDQRETVTDEIGTNTYDNTFSDLILLKNENNGD